MVFGQHLDDALAGVGNLLDQGGVLTDDAPFQAVPRGAFFRLAQAGFKLVGGRELGLGGFGGVGRRSRRLRRRRRGGPREQS
jgi:hypothetical protein